MGRGKSQVLTNKFQRKYTHFLEILEFHYNTVYDMSRKAHTSKNSSIQSATSMWYWRVTGINRHRAIDNTMPVAQLNKYSITSICKMSKLLLVSLPDLKNCRDAISLLSLLICSQPGTNTRIAPIYSKHQADMLLWQLSHCSSKSPPHCGLP